jgi:flavin reductase (DIM6/NTAB) family NADH-FMN oxidoreductase RutF
VIRNLDEGDARRLLGGAPIALLTCSYKGKPNVMPVAYVMPLSIRPPFIAVAISPERYSYDIIHRSEEFAINLPTRRLLHHVQFLGSVSGADIDKLELTKLPSRRARRVNTVLLEGCVGWIECGLEEEYEIGDHVLLVGRVVAAAVEEDAFSDHWLLRDEDEKPLHYLGANYYAVLEQVMEARVPKPAEEYERNLQEAVTEQLELSREAEERRAEEEAEREEFRRREGFARPE